MVREALHDAVVNYKFDGLATTYLYHCYSEIMVNYLRFFDK